MITAYLFLLLSVMTIVTPYFTFPCVNWWRHVVNADLVIFDACEHFEKMTNRNRYPVSGANNSILLSVPLINGRNQHVPMNNVLIHNEANWQIQHWRTLVSVYKRSPYFEYYEQSLQPFFETDYTSLIDFSRAGITWVKQQLNLKYKEQEATEYIKEYPAAITDLRGKDIENEGLLKYYQVFEDRIGFLPDLSILDLLFSEGPLAANILRGN